MTMTGCGAKGGVVYGKTDDKGLRVVDGEVGPAKLFATIYKLLGIDWRKEYMSPIGRPVKIANSLDDQTGEPVAELLG